MSIITNSITYGYGFNITGKFPVDSRMRVTHKSDLTTVFGDDKTQHYPGMVVEVCEENALYILKTSHFENDMPIAADPSEEASWTKVGDAEAINALDERVSQLETDSETAIDSISEIRQIIEDNEIVTAAALTTLDTKIEEQKTTFSNLDTKIEDSVNAINQTIEDNEEAIAAGLTDIDTRLSSIYQTIEDNEFISTVALTDLGKRIGEINQTIEDNEFAVSSLLNDLNTRIIDLETTIEDLIVDGGEF